MDRDLFDKIRNILAQGKQNLQAWGKVATDKSLRQDFGKYVIQPQARQAVAPPPPLAAETNVYKQKIKPAIEKIKIPYNPPFQSFLTTPKPAIKKASIGKMITSMIEEDPEMPKIREKLKLAQPLSAQEKKVLMQEQTFVAADIALTSPKKIKFAPSGVEGVKARIVKGAVEPPKKKGFFNWFDDIRRRLESEYHPVEKIGKYAKKKGLELPSIKDPEILVKRNLGSVGIAESELFGVGDIVRPHANEIDDLNAYLVAKRVPDLEARNIKTGVSSLDAQKTVEQLGSKFERTAQKLYLYQRSILQNYLVDTGMLSEDAFQTIIKQNPNYVPYQRLFEEAGIDVVPTKAGVPLKKIKGSEREILNPLESMIENTYKAVTAGEQNRLWRSVANIGEQFPEIGIKKAPPKIVPVAQAGKETVFRPSFWNPKSNTISFFENGKRVFYEVPPEVSRVANALGSSTNIMAKVMSYPAKLVRTGATGASPEFALIRNPIRDQFTALWNSESGYRPFADMFKGLSHYLKNDDMYRRYLGSGAGQSYMVALDREFKAKTLKELISKPAVIKKGGLLSKLQDISQLAEAGTRIGEYQRAVEKTGDPFAAAKAAREVSVDFSRIGKDARIANQLIPFINARVQGTIQIVKSALKHPARSGFLGVSLGAVPATLLYLHNRQYPEYHDIHDYEKRHNWIVMYGKPGEAKKFEIPKDFVIGQLFASTTENFLAYADKSGPDAMENLATNIFEFFSPVGNWGEALPAAIKPIIEQAANKSFFLDRELVPEYMKARPTAGQYHTGTREIAKVIGSKIGVAPTVVDNYLYGYLPGIFTQALNLVDFALGGSKFEDVEKLPFVRVFTVTGTGKVDSEIKNAYYDIQDRQQAIGSIKRSTLYSDEEKDRLIQEEIIEIGKSAEKMSKYQQIKEGELGVDFRITKDKETGYEVKGITKEAGAAETTDLSLPQSNEASKELYKDALTRIKNLENKLLTLPYEPKESYEEYSRQYDIDNAEADLERWQKIVDKFEVERPEKVFEYQLDTYASGGGMDVEERAGWAIEQLRGLSAEELQKKINQLWDGEVLTGTSKGTAAFILENYDLDVSNYTGTGDKGKKATTKKPPKITVKKTKFETVKFTAPKRTKPPTIKLKAPPKIKPYVAKPIKITTTVNGIPAIKIKPMDTRIKIVG